MQQGDMFIRMNFGRVIRGRGRLRGRRRAHTASTHFLTYYMLMTVIGKRQGEKEFI